MTTPTEGSFVVPTYSKGDYFDTLHAPNQDAPFKAREFLEVFDAAHKRVPLEISSYIDVGCGGGGTAELILQGLKDRAFNPTVKGYDVSPHVEHLEKPGIKFVHGDFCSSHEACDLVTLFDVFEHVPGPLDFIRDVASRAKYVAFHIPLDDTFVNSFLDRYRTRIEYPGHLIYLNGVSALNLLSVAGLLVLEYKYTMGFRAPSGTESILQKIAYPLREVLSRISPWLLSRTLGGLSLMVIARTRRG